MSFVVMGLVLLVRVVREYLGVGFLGIDYLGNTLLMVGWGLGYLLAEADHLFYVAMCNPRELSCQRIRQHVADSKWRMAWDLLRETVGERTRLPIHNLLTAIVVAGVGVWATMSGVGTLGLGVVAGLSVRLAVDFWREFDKKKWLWMVAREFEPKDVKMIGGVWTGLVVIQSLMLMLG